MSATHEPARIRVRVPFHDCDPLFVVWHGWYFKYLEQARTLLLARYDLDVGDIRNLGYRMYVTDARCRYLAPLTYNDEAEISAHFSAVTPLIRVSYQVRNLTQGRRSARALTVMATTDAAGNLLTETPDDMLARLPSL